tara:strand:- start:4165 stop:5124 length:960 start_codon:yes stop_codon:yes gene_type:complete
MAKYFKVTITTQLLSTFKVSYSTNSNPTVFDHTADIWAETTPYSPATGLTYDQLTDNGGLIVVTDDDVYIINIEDENNYCTDCTSNSFGVAQLTYGLSNVRFDYEYDAFRQLTNPPDGTNADVDITISTFTGLGTETQTEASNPLNPYVSNYTNIQPIVKNQTQSNGTNNVKIFDVSVGYDFGNPPGGLWYSLSGSAGYTGNGNLPNTLRTRTSDLAAGMSNSDTYQGNVGFGYEDVINCMGYLSYTASFTPGTNVTMSAAYSMNGGSGLNSVWVQDDIEVIESPGNPGEWRFDGNGADAYFQNENRSFWAKPIIKQGS